MSAPAARTFAIVVALLALVDPSWSASRHDRPIVSVLASDPVLDAALRDRVIRLLQRDFEVIAEPLSAADATVIAGEALSDAELSPRIFGVLPEEAPPSVRIEAADVSAEVRSGETVPVRVRVRTRGAASRTLTLTLGAAGGLLDRITVSVDGRDAMIDTVLSVLPSRRGALVLDLTAAVSGAPAARAIALTDVRDTPWRVLFHDARPSWMSTFVRRSVEQDGRFQVVSRITTSRGVAMRTGAAPTHLGDAQQLAAFDAVVVGAPNELTARDLAGVEQYARRGGSVVLLLDEPPTGGFSALSRVRNWQVDRATGIARINSASNLFLRSGALAWPTSMPPTAEVVAGSDTTGGPAGRPVVWTTAVGAGRIWVSGALDAWHFRDPAQSDFAKFWLDAIAGASAASVPPVGLSLSQRVIAPGDTATLRVTVRDLALADARIATGAGVNTTGWLVSESDSVPLTLLPGGGVGVLVAVVRGPQREGHWSVVVESDRGRQTAALFVAKDYRAPRRAERSLMAAVTAAHGGEMVESARLNELPRMLANAIAPASRQELFYPMRSAWWIVPVAFALGYEWWWRRRRGLV